MLGPVKNYCSYTTHVDCPANTKCQQLTEPTGDGGKYISCVNEDIHIPEPGCKAKGDSCTREDKCCSGTTCTNGVCVEEVTNCVVPQVTPKNTPTWQNEQLKVSVATSGAKATCKIGTRNTGYDGLEWKMDDADSKGYASSGQHSATISKSTIESALGIQGSKSKSSDSSGDQDSSSSDTQKVPVTLYVVCRNAEDDCQGKTLDSDPASIDCGNFPAEKGQQGSQNPEQGKNQDQDQDKNKNENSTDCQQLHGADQRYRDFVLG